MNGTDGKAPDLCACASAREQKAVGRFPAWAWGEGGGWEEIRAGGRIEIKIGIKIKIKIKIEIEIGNGIEGGGPTTDREVSA